MANEQVDIEEIGAAPVRACVECGHGEDEHVDLEAELPGRTARRGYCEACEEWHDFEPVTGD